MVQTTDTIIQETPEPFKRQMAVFNPSTFAGNKIVIIGCGALGSVLALNLVKAGFNNFLLSDIDTVELHNTSNQLYGLSHVGQTKVNALKEIMRHLSPQELILDAEAGALEIPIEKLNNAIVCVCVDSLQLRKQIFEKYEKCGYKLYFDLRVGLFQYEMFCLNGNPKNTAHYKTSMEGEGSQLPCTARGIITGIIVPVYVTQVLINYFRHVPAPYRIMGDIEKFQTMPIGGI